MDTFFAPPERLNEKEIQENIHIINKSPVIDGLLTAASGILAVLNEYRQILLLNDSFLKMLGVTDPQEILGLRPGEAINCVHAHDMEAGCGTSKFCSTCGAAIAIVSSLATQKPVEKKCIITIEREGKKLDLCLKVRSSLITFDGQRFILIFLQDITASQRWAEIERTFFHDISQLITGLHGASELMIYKNETEDNKLATSINKLSSRLLHEVAIQKTLLNEDLSEYRISPVEVSLDQIMQEINNVFVNHPVAIGKTLDISETLHEKTIKADYSLLLRVIINMVINAFEATDKGGNVKLWFEEFENTIRFCVWNDKAIPEEVAMRIFQRHFSTKQEYGRGIGTFAMKFFGENLLGGKVDFVTSEVDGTKFRFCLPQ